jgi:cytochrome c oxidase subunit 2
VVVLISRRNCLLLLLAAPRLEAQEKRVIPILAERFSFVPSQIKVRAGTVVEFRIHSEDTNHGFRIPAAGINQVIPKRGKGELRVTFHAEKPGRYDFECSKPCGAGHNMMRGVIIVE